MTNKRIIADDYTLHSIVEEEIKRLGNNADLNHIDTSDVTSMSNVFAKSEMHDNSSFNGDISQWDVSKVEHMNGMFSNSQFNGDISQWDVSNVQNMHAMFLRSKFNGNISHWNVSNVEAMHFMFDSSKFNGNISDWDVSKVETMDGMFQRSKFNGDVSQWNVRDDLIVGSVFYKSPTSAHPSFGKLHFMAKADDESIVLHPAAEKAYAASMPIAKAMYPNESRGVQAEMALETYRASLSQGAADSYDYTAALDACEESSSSAEEERTR